MSIEIDVYDSELIRAWIIRVAHAAGPSHQCLRPGEELLWLEGFCQAVVRTEFQSEYALMELAGGGQH